MKRNSLTTAVVAGIAVGNSAGDSTEAVPYACATTVCPCGSLYLVGGRGHPPNEIRSKNLGSQRRLSGLQFLDWWRADHRVSPTN